MRRQWAWGGALCGVCVWPLLLLSNTVTGFGPPTRRHVGNLSYTWSPEPCPPLPPGQGVSSPYMSFCLVNSSQNDSNALNGCALGCSDDDECFRAECLPAGAAAFCRPVHYGCTLFNLPHAVDSSDLGASVKVEAPSVPGQADSGQCIGNFSTA